MFVTWTDTHTHTHRRERDRQTDRDRYRERHTEKLPVSTAQNLSEKKKYYLKIRRIAKCSLNPRLTDLPL